MTIEDNQNNTVLIMGDWFIDENWLVAKHNTYSSSHTGDVHYISRHKDIGRRMISLCGAAEILEVLRLYIERIHRNDMSFIGIGAWSNQDDSILKCTLCPRHPEMKCLTPFTIKSLKDKVKPNICPYDNSQCKYNPMLWNLSREAETTSTNRIIRCYEGYGGGEPHLLYRFDWQLQPQDLNYKPLEKICSDRNIYAVIIEDHGQGVITTESISELIKVLKNNTNFQMIRWYIRTKIDDPKWMTKLRDENIKAKLIVIDYRLAVHKQGVRKWQYGKKLGRSSLEILGKLTGKGVYRHGHLQGGKDSLQSQRAAVMMDNNKVIAMDNDTCYNLHKSAGSKQLINIGRTTMFFNALIAQDLIDENSNFGQQCRLALQSAFDWSKVQSEEWNKEELNFYNYEKSLTYLAKDKKRNLTFIKGNDPNAEIDADAEQPYESANYSDLWNEWNASSLKYGILEKSDFYESDFNDIKKLEHIIVEINRALDKNHRITKPCIEDLNKLLEEPKLSAYLKVKENTIPSQSITDLLKKTKKDRDLSFSELKIEGQNNRKKMNRLLLKYICQDIPLPQEEFHVWRGEGILEKYIAVGGPKRDSINDLVSKISSFHENRNNTHPFNCLLFASPGWGKSFLANCLAKHFNMQYLEFSLSQMATTKDLIDCFDTICSLQNRNPKKMVLVLMDEVNCEIEGHSAMGLLLSPIWDGSFIREGKTYRLSPAVWIFASTEPINDMIGANKGSDFISRLNGPIIELDSLSTNDPKDAHKLMQSIKHLKKTLIQNPEIDFDRDDDYRTFDKSEGQFKTEQVYLGVSLLNNIWGPISQIQREVLKLFYYMLPINGFRSMEFFISNFKNIQRGIVVCSNVPSIKDFPELKRHIVMPIKWRENPDQFKDGESFVKIITIVK